MMNDDMRLLREYASRQSEAAFETLVSRHLSLVHSAALRQAQDPFLAEEVTQTVFIILARKAGSLSSKTILSGWLYRTTRYVSAAALKMQRRRERREHEACMSSMTPETQADAVWEQLAPLLDEAMAQLRDRDRDALVLRYFQNQSLREVGAALGMDEYAAQKRVARALEKLRAIFAKRGVAITAAVMVGAISAHSAQAAPVALAQSVAAAGLAQGAAASGSTLSLMKGALKIMAWTKVKTATVAGIAALLAAGSTTITVEAIKNAQRVESYFQRWDRDYLDTALPMVVLRPSKYASQGSWLMGGRAKDGKWDGKIMRRGAPFTQILFTAYDDFDCGPERMVLPRNLPRGQFDLLLTLPPEPTDSLLRAPRPSQEALRKEIKKQFGLVAHPETRETDVLVLKCVNSKAPGLKISAGGEQSSRWPQPGVVKFVDYKISGPGPATVVNELGLQANLPVVDETGLTNAYDIDFHWNAKLQGDSLKQELLRALREQLGLELAPDCRSIQMLVVERVR